MIHHTMGTADECNKEEKDKNTAMEHLQPARNSTILLDQQVQLFLKWLLGRTKAPANRINVPAQDFSFGLILWYIAKTTPTL